MIIENFTSSKEFEFKINFLWKIIWLIQLEFSCMQLVCRVEF